MINIGLVGCGYWGSKHLRIFSGLAGANLTIVCDKRIDIHKELTQQLRNVAVTSDFRDVLNNGALDAVVIATPVSTHYQLAKEALLHDKHVLVEKPLTDNSEQALELVTLSESRGKVLMVGHTFVYHPAVEYLRKVVRSGELGEIYYVDSARLNLGLIRPDVNVLWDLAPHDISIVLYLLDKELSTVSATAASNIDPAIYDVAYIELRFTDDTLAHIHVSWLDPCKVRQMTVVGSKKMAVYDDIQESEKIRIYDRGVIRNSTSESFSAWPPQYRFGDVTIPFISNSEPLKIECIDFIHSILEGSRPKSDGIVGLKIVDILQLANASARNNGRQEKCYNHMFRSKAFAL